MTAISLLAWWKLNAAALPVLSTETRAVADLRLGQLVRLPRAEKEALMRLLGAEHPLDSGAKQRQKVGDRTWLQ
jgi:hypothetical protein